MTTNYLTQHLPPSIVDKLEAGAYRSLCKHLQERSDEVQNLDLMTTSGFCRNCLAKASLHFEARSLSDKLKQDGNNADVEDADLQGILMSLDAMGYDEAALHVYGMHYGDWKKRHLTKASDEKMQKFNDSKPLWATHDKELLAKRSETPGAKIQSVAPTTNGQPASSLASNVCCQDVDPPAKPEPTKKTPNRTREVPPYQPPTPPEINFTFASLTVSDRASKGEYETGDLSGPAVVSAVEAAVASYGGSVVGTVSNLGVVPDDSDAIQSMLKEWADESKVDLILTTGGTGFSPRDVTPEATNQVVDRVCEGLVSFCTMECAKIQPLASLTRGSAGVRGKTLIFNLPGNPKGVNEIVPILLPLALHAIADIKKE